MRHRARHPPPLRHRRRRDRCRQGRRDARSRPPTSSTGFLHQIRPRDRHRRRTVRPCRSGVRAARTRRRPARRGAPTIDSMARGQRACRDPRVGDTRRSAPQSSVGGRRANRRATRRPRHPRPRPHRRDHRSRPGHRERPCRRGRPSSPHPPHPDNPRTFSATRTSHTIDLKGPSPSPSGLRAPSARPHRSGGAEERGRSCGREDRWRPARLSGSPNAGIRTTAREIVSTVRKRRLADARTRRFGPDALTELSRSPVASAERSWRARSAYLLAWVRSRRMRGA